MNTNSNTISFATLTGTYPAVTITSGTAINSYTLVTSGATNASLVTDLLFRNYSATAVSFNFILCATGSNTVESSQRVMITVPANSGNNGTTPLASLAGLAPSLFDLDLAGNRFITLEPGISIYVQNLAALTGDIGLTVKQRNF